MAINSASENQKLEIFTLIWLDASINTPDNLKTQTNLRQLTDQFKMFENCEQFQTYLQTVPIDERIILICSGRLGREIVPQIHQIEQIYFIYVYCFDREVNLPWTKTYPKIQHVLTIEKDLIKHIRNDNKLELSPINNTSLHLNTYQGHSDEPFIHSQLLIDYLLELKNDSTIDPRFYEFYKTEYVEEFQRSYSSETCLWWLTKDPCLCELLSQSLQTKNIDLLYLTRFLLRDIHHQLDDHQPLTSIQVYHSHFVDNDILDQLKHSVGKLISINTFLVTTYQRQRALIDLNQSNDLLKILFEINADPSIVGIKPFANITSLSSSKKHSQIVFMLGSIFRIIHLFQENDIWICKLDLSSENDDDCHLIFEQIKKEDGNPETELLSFGNILARLKLYNDAEKYFQHLLTELPIDHFNRSICYKNLGNVAFLKNDYSQSLEYHLNALEIRKNLLKSDHPSLADSYNCLGIVYFHRNEYSQAIDSYEKCLNILQSNSDEHSTEIILCLNNLALVYRTQENYSKGLEYYEKIFDLQKKYLCTIDMDHKSFGETYHNLGAFSWCLGSYDQAMKYYNLALENKNHHLSANDISIGMTLENIGLIYEYKKDYQQAYQYYCQANCIYQQKQTNLEQIDQNISRVSAHISNNNNNNNKSN